MDDNQKIDPGKDAVSVLFFFGSLVLMFSGNIVLILVGIVLLAVTGHYLLGRLKVLNLDSKFNKFLKSGIGILAVILIVVAAYVGLNPKQGYVEVSGISLIPPEGWEIEKYPEENILIQLLGPDEDGSRPYFSIEKMSYSGNFEEKADTAKWAIAEIGGTVTSESDTTVQGKKAKKYTYTFYKESKGYYGKGKILAVDTEPNELIGITVSSKESSYDKNESIMDAIIKTIKFD